MSVNAIDGLGLSEEQRETLRQGAWNVYEMAFMASIYESLPRDCDLPKQTYLERQRPLIDGPLARFNGDVEDLSYRIATDTTVSTEEWQRFTQVVSGATRGCVHWNGGTFHTTDAFRLVCMEFCKKNAAAYGAAAQQEWITDAQIDDMKKSPRARIGTFLLDCVPQLAVGAMLDAKRPETGTRYYPDAGTSPA